LVYTESTNFHEPRYGDADVTLPGPADHLLRARCLPDAAALLTPHTAGETQRYEDNVIEILRDNLVQLWRGDTVLRNQVV